MGRSTCKGKGGCREEEGQGWVKGRREGKRGREREGRKKEWRGAKRGGEEKEQEVDTRHTNPSLFAAPLHRYLYLLSVALAGK